MAYTTNPYNGLNLFKDDTQDANGQWGLRDYGGMVGKNNLMGVLGDQMSEYGAANQNRQAARRQANSLLTPQGRSQQTMYYRNQANAKAFQRGRELGAMIRAQGGSMDAQRGAMIDQQNRASDESTAYASQMESPESILNTINQVLGLNSAASIMDSLPAFLQLSNLALSEAGLKEQQRERGGGFLGSLLGTVAGGLPWGQILGGGK